MSQVSLDCAIAFARMGRLISFPTDTVPALATLPAQAELIFQAKQRSQDKPLILMAGEVADLWQFAQGSDRELTIWQTIADRYLPGALTLVLPASKLIPAVMNPRGNRTIGLRVPDCEIARSILRQTGALATTSANLSGEPPLLTMAEISANFPQVYALDTELNLPTVGQPSTVIQWDGSGWKLLRQGAISVVDRDE
ncbi:L-threonylcarbamoyladenylate synthase [Chamaesiphon sp. VAR_48_metabat_403]|uniref:L-threonylcarbamoyladenylate synthase n=1 Tax=Chamaesiphon sp. VAR_48_metabat_403 TaxID=2964700 RepID=UPI00286E8366|nr:L-threonylcarbamoyladenylate synthase [Chamaesiphon sp. VAR_48_metabat_403]